MHQPVLLQEVLSIYEDRKISTFFDGTLGAGGHAEAILEAHPEITHYLATDQDLSAIEIAQKRLARFGDRVKIFHANFSDIAVLAKEHNFPPLDGVLVDLGVSSMQLDRPERGFSFMKDGPLDMRMDPTATLTAEEIVNTWDEESLSRVIRDYGEEPRWRRTVAAIIAGRNEKAITTTGELVELLRPVLPQGYMGGRTSRKHFATLVFQGLRIAVNRELEVVERFIPDVIPLLSEEGRLAVITFHSLEDRIAKELFRLYSGTLPKGPGGMPLHEAPPYSVSLLTKKPLTPQEGEVVLNPRARCAKLRAVERCSE